jgi:hypothetical protein
LWGAYYNARKGEESEKKWLMSWNEERLEAMYDQARRAEYSQTYIPRPGPECKHFCDVAAHCQFAVD